MFFPNYKSSNHSVFNTEGDIVEWQVKRLVEAIGNDIVPETRILAYDHVGFIDDVKTPYNSLMKPATVVSRYGKLTTHEDGMTHCYPDLCDVKFDHKPEVSTGHFTHYLKPFKIKNPI